MITLRIHMQQRHIIEHTISKCHVFTFECQEEDISTLMASVI